MGAVGFLRVEARLPSIKWRLELVGEGGHKTMPNYWLRLAVDGEFQS